MDSKGLKERVTGGLITWLLVTIFIQPLLSLAWKAITVVGGFVHQGYVDRIYQSAALGDRNQYGFLMLGALFLAVPIAGMFLTLRRVGQGLESHILTRSLKVISKCMLILSLLGMFAMFTIAQGTMVIVASFTQRLTVLAPAINDAEYKALRAKWAGMTGKADYDTLVATMDKRATELGVRLPPVRRP